MKNRKLYLARFKNRNTAQVFYKIGQCYQYDASSRFQVEPEQYEEYDIKIMASAWGPAKEVDYWEQKLLGIKPKDFWVEGKFSGITEIRQYNREELANVFDRFKHLRSKWYEERHPDEAQPCC